MDSKHPPRQPGQELAKLEHALETGRRAERSGSIISAVLATGVLFIVAGFTWFNYAHLDAEWTEEKLKASLRLELEELSPTASEEAKQLGKHLLPVYSAEFRRQFPELAPVLVQTLDAQMKQFASELQADAHARVEAAEARIREQTTAAILAAFPDLRSDGDREKVAARFRNATEGAVSRAIGNFDAKFSRDVLDLEETILGFDAATEGMTSVDLQKKFIRLWLQLLDKEITKI